MKVGIYNDWWSPDLVGGTEISALEISDALIAEFGSENIAIFTLSNRLNTSVMQLNGLTTVRVGTLTLRKRYLVPPIIRILERVRIFFDFWSPFNIARHISRQNVNVVVIHNVDRAGIKMVLALKYIFNTRIIRVLHDLSDTCVNRKRYRKSKNCDSTCVQCIPKLKRSQFVARKSYEAIICNSEFTLRKFQNLGFLHNEMSFGYVFTTGNEVEYTKEILPLNANDIRIGFVGRISPEKGIEVILNALAVSANLKRTLILVGQGDDKYIKKLQKLANDLNILVQFPGFQKEPFEFLRSKIDLIIVPSKWEETLGRVAFEAGLAGIPVAVAEIGGLVEAASLSGRPFLTFNPMDFNQLSLLIRDFYEGKQRMKTVSPMRKFLKQELIKLIRV